MYDCTNCPLNPEDVTDIEDSDNNFSDDDIPAGMGFYFEWMKVHIFKTELFLPLHITYVYTFKELVSFTNKNGKNPCMMANCSSNKKIKRFKNHVKKFSVGIQSW